MGARKRLKASELKEQNSKIAFAKLNNSPIAPRKMRLVADLIRGYYSLSELEKLPEETSSPLPNDTQHKIESALRTWLSSLEALPGISIPGVGTGSLSFDTRTGFLVLPQFVSSNLLVENVKGQPPVPYTSLLIRMNTSELKQRIKEYSILFRTFIPSKYMEKFPLAKNFGIRRSFIFSRPGNMKKWFEEMNISIPTNMDRMSKRAAYLFEQNSGRAALRAAPATSAAPVTPAAPVTKGGLRVQQTRGRRRASRTKQTTRRSSHSSYQRKLPSMFQRIWKAYASTNSRHS
jgi:hypothetical protein